MRLTVVMPMKGRFLFTLRFLSHANRARLPYRFLIADGQVTEPAAQYLQKSREIFPALDVEYLRYPNDINYSRFFKKMSDVLGRVRTPYAMLADNDDFLGAAGIDRALDFLEGNADYVCVCSRVATFMVHSGSANQFGGVTGRLSQIRVVPPRHDVSSDLARERLRQGGLYPLTYYAVFRTEALRTICREAAQIDFSDLTLHETFFALRTLTLGKVRAERSAITYFVQLATSLSHEPSREWVRHLFRSRYTSDIDAVVRHLSACSGADDGSATAIAEDVRTMMEDALREFLLRNYGLMTEVKRFIRRHWPRAVNYFRFRPRSFLGYARSAVIRELAICGASQGYLQRLRSELSEIERTVAPAAFTQFAAPFLSAIRTNHNRDWY